ncbi:HesA/MoeB/ThiF family protein [Flagellimonas amoyensis]|uniref:HesA/MoeB/ThiF family protein n=1 Tax=Flagellimonas amoyensis TaxID=2169401 RepID=UPI001901D045|nr:ThiF family adenylyltransferase [Allomuricauda amoyensis]
MKKIKFKLPKQLRKEIVKDLERDHDHAYERVGFILTRLCVTQTQELIIAYKFCPVADEDYVQDESVGARINSLAIRKIMQTALTEKCGVFHVHIHAHSGKPYESLSDAEGIPPMMESISRINSKEKHGYLILSKNSAFCNVYSSDYQCFIEPNIYEEIGYPMNFVLSDKFKSSLELERNKRQMFLGEDSLLLLKEITIGIVGYGGGGSHIGLQLAHIGFENIVIFDGDRFEESNINRLVGANYSDIKNCTRKVEIAERVIKDVLPTANVELVQKRWQEEPEKLQKCDIIIGCVDSFVERQQLEAEARRYLIPLIDIGMDIHKSNDNFSISGQLILSLPGDFCMSCCGFITDKKLEIEAMKYGDVGGNPQVVWSNGVLASSAVGLLMDILFGWSGLEDRQVYLSYDGTLGIMIKHTRLLATPKECKHYLLNLTGPPRFIKI